MNPACEDTDNKGGRRSVNSIMSVLGRQVSGLRSQVSALLVHGEEVSTV